MQIITLSDGVEVTVDDGYTIEFENGEVGISLVKQNLVIGKKGGLCAISSIGNRSWRPSKVWSKIVARGAGIWEGQPEEYLVYDQTTSKTQKEIQEIEKTIQELQSKVSKLKSTLNKY